MKNVTRKYNKRTFLALILFSLVSINAHSDPLTIEVATLYSEGKAVSIWESIEEGHMEGNCYVFRVKDGIRTPKVRVCGTFSVEEKR